MRDIVAVLIVAQLLLSLDSFAQVEKQKSVTLSTISTPLIFSLHETGNKLIVEASINNSNPLRLVVDTGASPFLVLTPEAADALDINVRLSGLENEDGLLLKVGTIRSLSLFDAFSRSHRQILNSEMVYIIDMPDFQLGEGIAGIIGLKTLKQFTCEFNFDAKMLTLHPQGTLPSVYTKVPYIPLASTTRSDSVNLKKGAQDLGKWIIDTGQWNNIAAYSLQPHFMPQATMPSKISFPHKELPGIKYLVEHFTLGSQSVPLVEFQFAPEQKKSYLGMSLLSRFNLLFDWKAKQMRLLPRKVESFPFLSPLMDAVVISGDGKSIVTVVTPGLPCAEAGMCVGDEILAIDGKRLKQISSHLWQSTFYGVPGTQASILVKHPDGKEQTCTYIRESAYGVEASKETGIGFNLTWDKGRLLVYATRYRSPATRAGLLANDEIVSIDGVPVAKLGAEGLRAALRKPVGVSLQIEVMRNKKPRTVNVTVREYP